MTTTPELEAAPAPAPPEAPQSGPPRWLLLVKLLISAALVAWVLRDTPLEAVAGSITSASLPLVLASFSLRIVTVSTSCARWRLLLRAQGAAVSFGYLVRSFLTGVFFNNLLPSTIGGDALRAYDSWRAGLTKSQAAAVILTDRFLGLLALVLYAMAAALILPHTGVDGPLSHWILGGAVLAVGALWILYSPSPRLAALLDRIHLPLYRRVHAAGVKLASALGAFHGRQDILMKGFGLSLLLQALVVFHYYLIARALDLPIPFGNFFLIVPLALFVMLVPISINAIGVRESVFAFFFARYGVGQPQAVAFAWVAYGMLVADAIIGGCVYALRRDHTRPRQSLAAGLPAMPDAEDV